ncbi:ATP-dependent helicase HrpB [Aliishimia ponticola]|uniref:ATP-dependent helicase HrpB n=1 Tax=Aliishimia ponticola TaxID=2499833 RepID=A0A4S4NDN4_9RHOB|nr:ATP-dependent helicase HrpB [Aliishimia ponticola]THH36161.1 ATP-dependent helicase HrpB [Aliishimia ponticola]
MDLPISDILDDITGALATHGRAVVQAPPGAGKTTMVPLHLLPHVDGRILVLEPRRLAARHAAERMATLHGTAVGDIVGYRMRGEAKTSRTTRIEVVTEGILTRMLQSEPDLPGVGLVIFDEFHERSLNADLGLALCLEVCGALRDDLKLLVMSATLDAAPVAELMRAPILTSEGRSFPVDIRHLPRPLPPGRWEPAFHDLLAEAISQTSGGVLAFLPGEPEIRRAQSALTRRLPPDCVILPLYGNLPFKDQRRATSLLDTGRKVVLATSIAETSLTLPDISVVVDAGRARRARFDPGSGMSRLVTERASRAEATQRAGRAGRVGPGICFRLWTAGEEGAMAAFAPAEIETADLAPLALELAAWGDAPDALSFLTQPPAGTYAEARALLHMLGALDASGRITPHGQALSGFPLHPRLGHMLLTAGPQAAPLAALLSDRDPLPEAGADIGARLKALSEGAKSPGFARIRTEARRLEKMAPKHQTDPLEPGEMAALAYPDRVGLRRKGDAPRYLLSGGKGAHFREGDAMGTLRLLVATDMDGAQREARIRQAAPLTETGLRALFPDQIGWQNACEWSRREGRVTARQQERFGALVLQDRAWKDVDPDLAARAFLDGVRQLGITDSAATARFRARVRLARAAGHDLPDMSDDALLTGLEDWLLPHVTGMRSAEDWRGFNLLPALTAMLDWPQTQLLDRVAPAQVTTPLGRNIPVNYAEETPTIEVRLQEMFGTTRHPQVAGQPLRVTLLSPAGRPVQTTMDIPGFWATSYADVRKDMRGRYPKHPWPEDPTTADPTLRAKRRGT